MGLKEYEYENSAQIKLSDTFLENANLKVFLDIDSSSKLTPAISATMKQRSKLLLIGEILFPKQVFILCFLITFNGLLIGFPKLAF